MAFILNNKILKVELGEPGELYRGSRFDYSGNIRQITLNGKHTFCGLEKTSYSHFYGFGLVNEFGIECPLNYNESDQGEYFIKIGVGKLKKEDKGTYDFFKEYEKLTFDVKIKQNNELSVEYHSLSPELNGFKYFYCKKIEIRDNTLLINYCIENKGCKEILTTEYCHNFIAVDYCETGKDYNLEFEFSLQPDLFSEFVDHDNLINVKGNNISWSGTPQNEFFIGNINGNKSFKPFWSLKNYKTKAGISESVSSDCFKANLWGTKHVVSPELFYRFNIKPGEQKTWTRMYTFFKI